MIKAISLSAIAFMGSTLLVPVSAQYFNGYRSGDYFGGGNNYPPNNVIQRGNGYGSGDSFAPQRISPSQYQNSPNYGGMGLRDCSKYINC